MLVLSLLQWHACAPLGSCLLPSCPGGAWHRNADLCCALPSWPYNAYRIMIVHSTFMNPGPQPAHFPVHCAISWYLPWGPCGTKVGLSCRALPQVMTCKEVSLCLRTPTLITASPECTSVQISSRFCGPQLAALQDVQLLCYSCRYLGR